MTVRRLSLILAPLALLAIAPALSGCGRGEDATPPVSAAAQAAIKDAGGAPKAALGHAIDGLFDTGAVGATQALLVLKRGSVIVERYGAGIGAGTRLPGESAGQCLTALMIGQLVSDGRLRLDESAPVPEWQRPGDPRGEITLKHLLQMRAGLRHQEDGRAGTGAIDRESDRTRMLLLDGRDDMAGYAEAQPLEAPAGGTFAPSSASAVIEADLAARVLAPGGDPLHRQRAVGDYFRNRVLLPIGMSSSVLSYDRAGTLVGAGAIAATARDWADLGEFLRRTGSVRGAQILPRRWVQFMLAPSPRQPAYGAGVWLNRTPSGSEPSRLFPGTAPRSLFACLGEQGQYVIGSPDQLLTVVRLGRSDAGQEAQLRARLGELLALFPGGK